MAEVKKVQSQITKVEKSKVKQDYSSPKETLEKIKIKKRQRPSGEERQSRSRFRSRGRRDKNEELDSRIISIRRVSRVYKGGKRMRLSVVLVAGDKKGRVGIGVGKGADVKTAEDKAMAYAKKHLIMIQKRGETIPYEISYKKGAAKIFLRPAAPGTGIIAGTAIRAVVELAGIKDILSKEIGSRNRINNAYATLEALSTLKTTRL